MTIGGQRRSRTSLPHESVVVAEIKSLDNPPFAVQRSTFAALVPSGQIDAVKAHLAQFDQNISTSGPYPFYMEDRPFQPEFWIAATNLPAEKYEPLVLQWRSHHSTVLHPDPGFLMTYGLVPRPGKAGTVYWDDPRTPRPAIVTVSAPALWNFPLTSRAYVSIARDFLQDYLTLRHMALVQVFWEIRWAKADADIDERLGEREGINIDDYSDRRFQIVTILPFPMMEQRFGSSLPKMALPQRSLSNTSLHSMI